MNAALLVLSENTIKRQVALKLPCVLGRSREADVIVVHPLISRRHCELSETDGLLMLRDLVSLNGTMIGGRRIASAPLLPGAEFTIGPFTFRVQYAFNGDRLSIPPVCFVDAAEGEAELNEIAARADEAQIAEPSDFSAWTNDDAEEAASAVILDPEKPAGPPLLLPQSAPRESPWAAESPENVHAPIPPPTPNQSDEIDRTMPNFLEDLS